MGFRKNQKRASKATKSVDKAQNELLKGMKKSIDELKADVETKYVYQIISDQISSYDGTTDATRQDQIITVPIGDTQGLTDQTRVGDEVTLKHIDFNYRVTLNPPVGSQFIPPQTTVRILLFWDNQPTAVTAAGATGTNPVYWNNMLQLAITGATNNDQKQLIMMSEKNWDNRKRYSIFYDQTHTLCPNQLVIGVGSGNGPRGTTGCIRFNKNYNGRKIRYINGGRIPQNRRLYMAYLSDCSNDVGSLPAVCARPTIQAQIRCLYDDA